MSSPYRREGKGREMEKTKPERLGGTVDNAAKNEIDSILQTMREWEKASTRNNQPRSYPWDKKAGTMQTSTSPMEASSDNNSNNNTNDSQLGSTTQEDSAYSEDGNNSDEINSDDNKDVETLQPSRHRTHWELFSDEVPSANESEESSINMVRGTSDYADSGDKPPTSPESENSYSKFRQNGDLMTRHMFSGKMNGKRPVYIPIYKRDKSGHLFRLKKNKKGVWEYVKLEKLSASERQESLKLFEDPKAKKGYPKLEDSKRPKT